MNILNLKKKKKKTLPGLEACERQYFYVKSRHFCRKDLNTQIIYFPSQVFYLPFTFLKSTILRPYKAPQSSLFYNVANLLQVFLRKSI